MLAEIGADEVPTILVYNKIDAAGLPPQSVEGPCGTIDRLWVSARTGAGLDLLNAALSERFLKSQPRRTSDSDAHGPDPLESSSSSIACDISQAGA